REPRRRGLPAGRSRLHGDDAPHPRAGPGPGGPAGEAPGGRGIRNHGRRGGVAPAARRRAIILQGKPRFMKTIRMSLAVLAAAVALGACSKKPQPAPAPAPEAARPANDDAARREAEERARREAEEARRAAEERARAQEILASVVHFDYDSFTIREDSKRVLDAKVPLL